MNLFGKKTAFIYYVKNSKKQTNKKNNTYFLELLYGLEP